jgi:hypothetical protein
VNRVCGCDWEREGGEGFYRREQRGSGADGAIDREICAGLGRGPPAATGTDRRGILFNVCVVLRS